MAQVFKRKWTAKDGSEQTSKVYYCRFQVGSKDYLRSTGKTKWADAKAEMERLKMAAREGASIALITEQLRGAIHELPPEKHNDAQKDIAHHLFTQLQKTLAALPTKQREGMRKEFSKRLIPSFAVRG